MWPGACSRCCRWISLQYSFWELGALLPIYLTLEILAPCQWTRGSLKTDGGVLEELLGRLCLPRWEQLVLGSHAWGEIAFGVPDPHLLPVRLQLRR